MTLPPDEPDPPHRPTPVRILMQSEAATPTDVPAETVLRKIESGKDHWTVREAGATRSGSGTDRGAPMLLLQFEKVEAPEVPPQVCYAVAESLDNLDDEDLIELLRRSRPVPPTSTRSASGSSESQAS
jgi:hypothetical protein